jgi:hypothetical protein
MWLANCYFAHNSLRFPALLPFFNASSRRPFHPPVSIYPAYREPFDLIFQRMKKEEWCAQGDDFRTFLAEFVPNVQLFEIPSELSW